MENAEQRLHEEWKANNDLLKFYEDLKQKRFAHFLTIQTAFLVLMPQILLSGMIFPLDAMAVGVRWIGYLLPLTYFTIISQGIMLRGASIASLWYAYVILAVMAVVVFTGATLRFRRDLAPGGKSRAGESPGTSPDTPSTPAGAGTPAGGAS